MFLITTSDFFFYLFFSHSVAQNIEETFCSYVTKEMLFSPPPSDVFVNFSLLKGSLEEGPHSVFIAAFILSSQKFSVIPDYIFYTKVNSAID